MKSPFAFFRKHARVLTVVLTGLAMFAFVIMDQIRDNPELFPVTMGVLGGGLLLWIIGKRTGHAVELAVAGAILGGVLSYNSISGLGFGPGAVVETSVGRISQRELGNLVNRRQLANRFIADAYYRSNSDQQFARQPPQFGFGDTSTTDRLEEDVVLGYLLRHEAAHMGIAISKETVNEYINQVTNNKLSKKVFQDVLSDMGLGFTELFDLIRDQLTARTALQNLIPRNLPTPEEYWRLYRQMNVTQRLEVVAVPVADFESDVAEPEKAELEAYFEKHKMVFANTTGPGEPGFHQPPRVRLAYVEADYETFENKVGDVSVADVEKFYEENKELYRNRRIPNDPLTNDDTTPLDPEFVPEEGAEPGEAAPADDGGDTEAGSTDADKPVEDDGSADDSGEADGSESPAEASLPNDTLRDATGRETGTGLFRNAIAVSDEVPLFQLASAESVLTESDEEPPPDSVGEESPDESADESAGAADDSTAAGESTEATDTEDAAEITAETATETSEPDAEAGDAQTSEERESLPEFRPLDEELRDEIRDQMLRERAFQAMGESIKAVEDVMFSMGVKYAEASDEEKKSLPQQFDSNLKSYAEQNSLRYVATDWLSPQALADTETYPIGGATELGTDSSAFGGPTTTVREKVFVSAVGDGQKLYRVDVAESRLISSRYAYWTIDYAEQRVPAFTDEGIEAQVLASWKNENARPLARARADELAEIVRSSDTEMPESLAEKTVDGKETGESILVRQTESFSWLRQSSAPQTNPFNRPPPQLSAISAIDLPSPEFMRIVFDQLGNGEVGVAANLDRSIYYVVKIKERVPATPSGEEAFRQAFLQDRELFFPYGFSAYGYLIAQEQQAANHIWSRRLLEKYDVNWAEPVAQAEP